MIRKVEELKRLIVSMDQGYTVEELIAIVEGQKKCSVQMIHEIGRGEANMISQGRVMFNVGDGSLGTSVKGDGLKHMMVTYVTDDTKSFSKIIKKAEDEEREREEARKGEIRTAEALDKIAERDRMRKALARMEEEAAMAAEEAGIEESVEVSEEVLSHLPNEE